MIFQNRPPTRSVMHVYVQSCHGTLTQHIASYAIHRDVSENIRYIIIYIKL